MRLTAKSVNSSGFLSLCIGVAACAILAAPDAMAQSRYGHAAAPAQRYVAPAHGTPPAKYGSVFDRLRDQRHPHYQRPGPVGVFQQWVEFEPEYTLVPGDQLDIVVASAPELSRTLTVGPDGRVVMPMVKPVMAAGRSFSWLQAQLTAAMAQQLRDPTLTVTPRAYAPEQIYVGGQVGQPGTYTLPGRIGADRAKLPS